MKKLQIAHLHHGKIPPDTTVGSSIKWSTGYRALENKENIFNTISIYYAETMSLILFHKIPWNACSFFFYSILVCPNSGCGFFFFRFPPGYIKIQGTASQVRIKKAVTNES